MKKLLLSIALFAGFSASAQVYFNASTQAEFFLGSVADLDGDSLTWGVIDAAGFPSTAVQPMGECLASSSYDNTAMAPLTPDNLYLTAPINLVGATGTINLTWKAASPETTVSVWYQEFYSVYVFDGNSNAAAAFAAAPLHTGALTAGEQIFNLSYPVSSFAGADSLIVAFRHHNCTDENYLLIDDIRVSGINGINENVTTASVYPNPVVDVVNFEVSEEISSIVVTSLEGKTVATTTSTSLNVSEFNVGMYLYTIETVSGKVAFGNFTKK